MKKNVAKSVKVILSVVTAVFLTAPNLYATEVDDVLASIQKSDTSNYFPTALVTNLPTGKETTPNYETAEVAALLEDNQFTVPKEKSDNQQLTNGLLPPGTPVSPTPPAKANAAVTENVGANNKPFVAPNFSKDKTPESSAATRSPSTTTKPDYSLKTETTVPPAANSKQEGSNYIERRQFVTITTRSGKQFYLIINHDAQGQEAQLLTEVSEQDLLNMIVAQPEYKKTTPEVQPAVIESKPQEVVVPAAPPKAEKSGFSFLTVVSIGAIGILLIILLLKHPEYLEPIKRKFRKDDPQDEYENDEVVNKENKTEPEEYVYYNYENAEEQNEEETNDFE